MDIKIEKMDVKDLYEISQELETEFDNFWNLHIFEDELRNTNSSYIIAKSKNEIVGFAGIWRSVDDVHITNIVTRKKKRTLGIGSKLLESLIHLSTQEGFKEMTLEVANDNIQAINLYKKYHFIIVGERKNYYKNKTAIIMTLSL